MGNTHIRNVEIVKEPVLDSTPETPTPSEPNSEPVSQTPTLPDYTTISTTKTSPSPVEEEVISKTPTNPEPEADAPRWLVLTLQILAYAIPLGFLLYVLYINYLPFGYNKTFTIDVGSIGDTDSSREFYLEPSPDLSDRKTAEDGTTYRELNGMANVVFNPGVVLKDAKVSVSVEGDGVEIIPPVIDLDPNSIKWDYNWDFTQGKKPGELGLTGNAYPFDEAMYFDGKSRLELAGSSDKFEDGPFTVYAEWTPTDSENDFQEIVGHYNWEILQNKDSVSFQVGEMDSSEILFYRVKQSTLKDFFNKKHQLLAIYSPKNSTISSDYIELYIDKAFAGRTYLENHVIKPEYNKQKNISFGKSQHGIAKYLFGYVQNVRIISTTTSPILQSNTKEVNFTTNNNLIGSISIVSNQDGFFKKISLKATQ